MEEERFVEEQIEDIEIAEVNETVIPVIDETIILSPQNETIEANVEETEVFNVTISEDVGPHALKIVSDHAFDLPRQHSIGAIEGLREELDEIERLKAVYSDGKNQANYYMWQDENPNQENRDGYFVSIHQNDNKIRICKSDEDEFGVTVSDAGFIGNQNEEIPRGSNYGLVVNSGLVSVRCETDVVAGDYVVSDDYGVAKKTDGTYGYLVTAISKVDSVGYAIISLTMPTTQMQKFSETAQDVADRIDSAEINIATAISVANAAYNKAQVSQEWVQGNVENIAGQVGNISGIVNGVVGDITKLGNDTATAKEEALKAQNAAATTLKETQNLNNSMHSNLASLVKHLDPDSTWTDPETGENWDTYFVDYIEKGNIPTSSIIKTFDGRLKQNAAETSHNAAQIKQILTSTDMYSIGEWSQAYGLNLAEAWNILKVGMVYIPTTALHAEKYEYETLESWGEDEEEIKKRDTNLIYRTIDDKQYWRYLPAAPDGTLTYEWTSMPLNDINGEHYIIDEEEEFTRGYFYTWNGYYWVESDYPVVIFSGTYVNNAAGKYLYWYMDTPKDLTITDNGTEVTYRARSLYKWEFGEWVEVNALAGNIINRVTSSFIRTASEIAANVASSRLAAHMGIRVDENGSYVNTQASAVTPLLINGEKKILGKECIFSEIPTDSIVGVEGQYYAVGTGQPYDIYIYKDGTWQKKPLLYYDGTYIMKINTSSILLSANEDEAIVSVNGPAIFTADENGGVTGINGSCITTGTIASNDGTVKIDLGQGTAGISGRVTATSGYIGNAYNGFTIANSGEYVYQVGPEGLSSSQHTITRPDGSTIIRTYKYAFFVNNVLYAFGLRYDLNDGDQIIFNSSDLTMQIYQGDNQYSAKAIVIPRLDSSVIGTLEFTLNGYYYLSNEQTSLIGDSTGNAGVYISPEGIGLGNGNFYVTNEGHLTTKGNVTMKSSDGTDLLKISDGSISLSGNITWDASASPVRVLYAKTDLTRPTNNSYNENSDNDWHTKKDSSDCYASYSYDGGNTWTDAILIQGSDATVTDDAVFKVLTQGGQEQGLFSVFQEDVATNKLYINAEYISAGTLSGVKVKSVNDENHHTIEMDDGFIYFKPDNNTDTATKMKIGFNTVAKDRCPYILFGAGTGDYNLDINGMPIISGTGLIYKSTNAFVLNFHGTDKLTHGIYFYDADYNLKIPSYMSFGESTVDFSNANVKGIHPKFA